MGEGRFLGKAALAFEPWEDAIILDRVPKAKPWSAHVRTGRTVDAIMRRYSALVTKKAKKADGRKQKRSKAEMEKRGSLFGRALSAHGRVGERRYDARGHQAPDR